MIRSLPLATLFLSLGAAALADEAKYDLRGPGPKKGQKITQTAAHQMKGGKATFDDGNVLTTLDVSLNVRGGGQVEVLAVNGRDVTKVRVTVAKRDSETTFSRGGMQQTKSDQSPLAGRSVVLEKVKGQWTRTLEGDKATAKQAEALKDLDPLGDGGLLHPAEKVAKGHKWNVKASVMCRALGENLVDVTGQAKGHFRAVQKFNGEMCAVIDFDLDVRGTCRAATANTRELKARLTVYRSLKTGLDVKTRTEGTARMRGRTGEGSARVDTDLQGKVTSETTASVK